MGVGSPTLARGNSAARGSRSASARASGRDALATSPDKDAPLASEVTETGEQTLIPGVQPISLRERLEHRMLGPLTPLKLQKPLDIGLFDLAARSQLDLF